MRARGISIARQRLITMVCSAIFPGLIGGFFAIDDYTSYTPIEPVAFVLAYLIPLVAQAVDEARIAVESDD